MTNTQLYLAIGLPTLTSLATLILVLIAWLSNRTELHRLSDKIDRISDKIGRLDDKLGRTSETLRGEIDALRTDTKAEFALVRAEMANLRAEHRQDFKEVLGYMVPLHERMTKLEVTR